MVLSGILVEQAGGVEESARQHGLQLVETLQSSDWVALAFRK
jgi:ribosomal protein L11 methylase PrmA